MINKLNEHNEEQADTLKSENPSLLKDDSKKCPKKPDFESLVVETDKNNPLEVGIDMDINKQS